jgi:hypothetical protein
MARIAAAVMMMLVAGAARAESGGLSLAGRMGTQGFGLEASKSLTSHVNLRGGLNLLNYSRDMDADRAAGPAEATLHFDGQLRLKSVALLADVYPSKRFHLTGGLILDRNVIRLEARPTSPVIVNDETYAADEIGTLTGTTTGAGWVPYAGFGFGNPATRGRRLSFLMDFGVVFQGQPHLQLTATRAADAGVEADVDAAAAQVNRDHLNTRYFRYYPVVSVGVGLRLF